MRIGKHGQGSGSSGDPSLHQGREARARTFRNSHHVGETVTGRFMKREPSGLAWVSFDGLPLLASIDGDPRPGSLLHFAIKSLVPDIVLREVRGQGAGSGSGQAQTVVDFDTTRHAFETAAREQILAQPLPHRSGLSHAQSRHELLNRLSTTTAKLYLAAALGQASINTHLARSGPTRFLYLPWLLPALRCDLLIRRETKDNGTTYHELSFGFESPDLGPGQLRILSRQGLSGVRVLLERSEHLVLARAVLTAMGKEMDESVTLLGASTPPRYAQGGVLSQLLAPDPHKLLGLRS